MARKSNNQAEAVSETVETAEQTAGTDHKFAVALEKARTEVVNFLAGAVAELRSIEAGKGPELDIESGYQKCLNILETVTPEGSLQHLENALDCTRSPGATADGVLEELGEADRAEVLLLVEALGADAGPGVEDGPAAEATNEPAVGTTETAAAWAKLVEVVGQGLPLEEADRHAREVAEQSKLRRAELKKIIKDAEVELGRVEHAARNARSAYMNLANADRAREARLSKRTKLLVAAVDEAHRNGQRVSENVRRVVEAAGKGLPITAEMVGLVGPAETEG